MSSKFKNRLIHSLKFLFAFALVYWLISRGSIDFSAIKYILTPTYLGLCFVVAFVSLLCNHWRWLNLLKARGFEIEFWRSLPLTLMGLFFNFTMPGAVGGDVAKMFYLAKHFPNRRLDAGTTVIVDRVVGLYVMVLLAFFSIILNYTLFVDKPTLRPLLVSICLLVFVLGLGALLFLSRRLKVEVLLKGSWAKLKGFKVLYDLLIALRLYKDHKRFLIKAALLSVTSQMLAVGFFVIIGLAIGEQVEFLAYIFAVCLGFIVSALPISPGGVGVGQLAFLYFFKIYTGRDLQVGTIGITLYQVILFVIGLVGAAYFVRSTKFKKSDLEMAYD